MKTYAYTGALLGIAGLISACGGMGFEEFYEVSKLRTLAIGAEPPEIGPGQSATFSTLTVNPSSDAPITYQWEACLFTDGPDAYYACSETEQVGVAGIPLGSGPSAELSYDLLTAAGLDIAVICASLDGIEVPDFITLPDCTRGLPLTIRLVATQGSVTEVSKKTFTLLRPEEAGREDVNTSPVAGDLTLNGQPAQGHVLSADSTLDEVELLLDVDLSQAQTYEPPDPANDGQRLESNEEELNVAWFTTHGTLEYSRTYYAQGITPVDELGSNRLDLTTGVEPETGETITLWAVLRDDRGGISWRSWSFSVSTAEN
jgi:hypothetical protein